MFSKNVFAMKTWIDLNGAISIEVGTCEELVSHVDALSRWSQKLGENPKVPEIDCKKSPVTSLDISSVIPSTIKSIYGRRSICRGPNCYNAAMIANNTGAKQRFVSNFEWAHYLKNNCKIRSPSEKPKPGDIVAIRKKGASWGASLEPDPDFFNVHGFIYVDENLAFHKPSPATDNTAEFDDFSNILNEFKLKQTDTKCINSSEIPPLDCDFFLNYFDCSSYPLFYGDPFSQFESALSSCTVSGNMTTLSTVLDLYKAVSPVISHLEESLTKQLDNLNELASSPLELAIRKHDKSSVKALLESGVDVNKPAGRELPIIHAIDERDISMLKLLAENHANLNEPDRNLNTALCQAVIREFIEGVQFLLDQKVNTEFQCYPQNWTALDYAADQGNLGLVKLLIQHGAVINPNEEKKNSTLPWRGKTPLARAVLQGRLDVVKFLLSMGADPHAVTHVGFSRFSILDFAKNPDNEGNKDEVLKLIEEAFQKNI